MYMYLNNFILFKIDSCLCNQYDYKVSLNKAKQNNAICDKLKKEKKRLFHFRYEITSLFSGGTMR